MKAQSERLGRLGMLPSHSEKNWKRKCVEQNLLDCARGSLRKAPEYLNCKESGTCCLGIHICIYIYICICRLCRDIEERKNEMEITWVLPSPRHSWTTYMLRIHVALNVTLIIGFYLVGVVPRNHYLGLGFEALLLRRQV